VLHYPTCICGLKIVIQLEIGPGRADVTPAQYLEKRIDAVVVLPDTFQCTRFCDQLFHYVRVLLVERTELFLER